MVKDPICGMELDKSAIHSSLIFKEKEYYFDSESCETLFRKLNKIELLDREGSAVAETERKMIAYNTLKQLAVTIAHYIRNANTTISAQAQIHDLPIIKRESEKIESVVSALLSLSDIRPQKYVMTEEDAILDLRNTLEDKLSGAEGLK